MIQQIEILNFQSHEHSTLELHPGVNIIVGSSDSGKTAVLRALKWLIWNRPLGDSFRSHWGGNTEVCISTEAFEVTRVKGQSFNGYVLGQGTNFEAIKSEVPEEIQTLLNINEINFQPQFTLPFLLFANPGEVARHFNKVAHLDQIDSGLKMIESSIRSINSDLKHDKNTLDDLKTELENYDHLEQFEAEIEVLEEMDKKRLIKIKQNNSLNSLITEVEQLQNEIEEESIVLEDEKLIDELLSLYHEKKTKETQLKIIKNLTMEIEQTKNSIQVTAEDLKNKEERFHDHFPDICPLCGSKTRSR